MKHLPLKNREYKKLESGFENWLATLGYAKSTVIGSPTYVKEFFHYLEQNQVHDLSQINNQVIKAYFIYLNRRPRYNGEGNRKKIPGALSTNSLRNNFNALRRFAKYLRETGQGNMEVAVPLPVTPP